MKYLVTSLFVMAIGITLLSSTSYAAEQQGVSGSTKNASVSGMPTPKPTPEIGRGH